MKMFPKILWLIAICSGGALAALERVEYAVAAWEPSERGNHRAVVEVAEAADAVCVTIPWRRHDPAPELKGIRCEDEAGNRIGNVLAPFVSQAFGTVVFRPERGAGIYHIYYLPYREPQNWWDRPGPHLAPEFTAEAGWCERNDLTNAAAIGALPKARVLRLEARTEFDRFDPMEVAAAPDEVAQMLPPDGGFRVFVEDRHRPIRMQYHLPLRWLDAPAEARLTDTVRPGEIYAFQLGIWSPGARLENVVAECSDAALQFSCINQEGVDAFGDRMQVAVHAEAGEVLPLWCLVRIPAAASGVLRGEFAVRFAGGRMRLIPYELTVSGEVLTDGGVGEPEHMGRLAWLNSTIAQDDEVSPPFTPLEVDGNRIRCVGRGVLLAVSGLPEAVDNGAEDLLARPVQWRVTAADGEVLAPLDEKLDILKRAPGRVDFVSRSRYRDFVLELTGAMEMDGAILYRAGFHADRAVELADIELVLPYRAEMADYMMGWSARGGTRQTPWDWRWKLDRADNMLWLGDPKLGMQLYLPGARRDRFDQFTLEYAGLPAGWRNRGAGGGKVRESDGEVRASVFTGALKLTPAEPLLLDFRLLVTPMKPYALAEHWNWRYSPGYGPATIFQLCHARETNWWINYPFLDLPGLGRKIQRYRNQVERRNSGFLEYPATEVLSLERGSIDVEFRIDFDTSERDLTDPGYHRPFLTVVMADGATLAWYWNGALGGIVTHIYEGVPPEVHFLTFLRHPLDYWQSGETHRMGLSWDGEQISYYLDGHYSGGAPYPAAWKNRSPEGGVLRIEGPAFALKALRFRNEPLTPESAARVEPDAHTVCFQRLGEGETAPGAARGKVLLDRGFMVFAADETPQPVQLELYYAARELSNRALELWAFRALRDEIFAVNGFNYSDQGAVITQPGEGYYWLREHLVRGYAPAWMEKNPTGEFDAAIALNGPTRYHNFYLESVDWLMRNIGVEGIYLDGFGAERTVAKRLAKVMARNNPDYTLSWHGGNNYDYLDMRTSILNTYMEILPYLKSMWIGEFFDFDRSPDYWLVEISGIPFGTPVDLLNHVNGGNPWRGMLFGALARMHGSSAGLWPFFDQWGIAEAGMIGWWDKKCPVSCDNPEVLATVYPRPDKALIAVAHWAASVDFAPKTARSARTAEAPVIDGELDDPAWAGAARLTNFSEIRSGKPLEAVADNTEVWVAWDMEKLYVAFRAHGSPEPKATVSGRDGAVWEDDAIEMFIQPDRASGKVFQFVGNSLGTIHDNRNLDAGWNGGWEYRTRTTADGWQGEAAIRWSDLDRTGAPPEEIGMNFGRDHQTPRQHYSSWSYCKDTFHDREAFGTVALVSGGASSAEEPLEPDPEGGRVRVRLDIDCAALGFEAGKVRFRVPGIAGFQEEAECGPEPVFTFPNNRGLLIEVMPE